MAVIKKKSIETKAMESTGKQHDDDFKHFFYSNIDAERWLVV